MGREKVKAKRRKQFLLSNNLNLTSVLRIWRVKLILIVAVNFYNQGFRCLLAKVGSVIVRFLILYMTLRVFCIVPRP